VHKQVINRYATLADKDRTNNLCESWNCGFASLVGHHHPSLWTVVEVLQQDEALATTAIIQEARGQQQTRNSLSASSLIPINYCTAFYCHLPLPRSTMICDLETSTDNYQFTLVTSLTLTSSPACCTLISISSDYDLWHSFIYIYIYIYIYPPVKRVKRSIQQLQSRLLSLCTARRNKKKTVVETLETRTYHSLLIL